LDVPRIYSSNGTTRIVLAPPPDRTPSSKPAKDESVSHENSASSFGVVYVNEVARRSLIEDKKPRFPSGSVIVREKLSKATDAAPQMLVMMVKREKGFNSKALDWEFLMIDVGLNKVLKREKSGACLNCHKQQKKQDFVFRSYMSDEMRAKQNE
jgi:hypothetical protein